MALDLSALTAYVDELSGDLIKESILRGRTVDLVTVQGGIKSAQTINRLSTTLNAASGACGWSATNSTTLDQRTITVCDIKINEAICLNDLEDYYTQTMMNPGSYNENIPFEQIFAENKRDSIMALIEDLIWQGDVSGGSGNLAKVDEAVNKIPENIINNDDLTLFMSYADFRTYAKALRDANLYHYDGGENQGGDFTMMVPGTNVRVIAVRGLSGQGRFCVASASNLYVGTDLLSDAEDFKIFYSQDNDEVRFLAKWKIGVQVAWLDEVVWYVGS
jgi:hypothetical protein